MHLRNGLQSERVRMSAVECEAVVHSYAECYLFLMTGLELSAEEQRAWYEDAAAMVRLDDTCTCTIEAKYTCISPPNIILYGNYGYKICCQLMLTYDRQ